MDDEAKAAQEARIAQLWKSLDTRGQGQLDLAGLRDGLSKINHPLKNANELLGEVLQAVDTNGDGRIQYHEFYTFVKHAEAELKLLFKNIDRDENNKLTRNELQTAFESSGIVVPKAKLDAFFSKMDLNQDGVISFDEWRDFLLFIPADAPGLRAVLSYFSEGVKMNAEGDVLVREETAHGLGTQAKSSSSPFGIFTSIFAPRIRHRPPDPYRARPSANEAFEQPFPSPSASSYPTAAITELTGASTSSDDQILWRSWKQALTALLPNPGYFLAGGISGIVSRTSTAPLDRLKVYLITQTNPTSKALEAARKGSAVEATKHAARPLLDACSALWKAGGVRSLFAGNGLNVVKVMPESAIKFGSYEASKRLIAHLEGHDDPSSIHPWSQFAAGGTGGLIAQFCVYPIDTLKFRMQCDTVEGGLHGNRLIASTAYKMWTTNGIRTFYRGLSMGLVGMFPYSAIDLGTFEYLKRTIISRNAIARGCREEDAAPGSIATATIGGFSGALGASLVYPLNLLRTRLQTQGTAQHPRTYKGIMDVTRQTIKGEGIRGLFKGLTPNLLKVVPAVSITYVVYENSKKMLHLS